MKKVNFEKLSLCRFLSIGSEPVVVEFKPGVNILTGINRDKTDRKNGVGKSTIAEGLNFCVFGNIIRPIDKKLIPNNIVTGPCEGILYFTVSENNTTDSYKIIRQLRPSKLFLYKNGEDITRDSIKNTEEDIFKIICGSQSIFENCVIMSLNGTTPFMGKTKVDKRKFIESIFNLEIFSKMLLEARADFQEAKRVYEIELSKYELQNSNLKSLEGKKESILKTRKEKLHNYLERKERNMTDIDNLKKETIKKIESTNVELFEKITKNKENIKLLQNKKEELNNKKSILRVNISNFRDSIKNIGVSGDICPQCLKPNDQHDKTHIEQEKQKLTTLINKNQEDIKKIDDTIVLLRDKENKLEDAIEKFNNLIRENDKIEQANLNINSRIKQLEDWLNQLENDINELKSTDTDVDQSIIETIDSIEVLKQSIQKYKADLNIYDAAKFIVSEEGVKAFITSKVLSLFNNKIKQYLAKMDSSCVCTFDEFFEERIINRRGKECSYYNFSGAEKKDIDFACLFTFMDMRRLQGNVVYNLSIYDELFDTSLDEKGVDLVMNILKERVQKYNECIIVISHRKESVKVATGECIFLEKKNDITKRIDYNPFN